MGKTHSKPLAARHGKGTAWARHGNGMLCVNRPLEDRNLARLLPRPALTMVFNCPAGNESSLTGILYFVLPSRLLNHSTAALYTKRPISCNL